MKKFAPTSDTPRRPAAAFTLIELLVVIGIIGLLAGMLFPITRAVNRSKIRSKAKVELAQVQTAIEAYKMKLGHYPPDNPASPMRNPLYYELTGTAAPAVPWLQTTLNRSFAGEEAARAIKFLTATQRGQIGDLEGAQIIVCSVKSRMPDGSSAQSPVRYLSTNPLYNKNSFDLWIDVVFDGKTNRFSNWSSAPVIVYEPGI